jgi:hypothetical protein
MAMSDADLENMRAYVQGALRAMTASLEDFQRKAKESVGPSGGFKQLDTMLGGMAKTLVGPVGVVAGLYAAGKAVSEFADQRLKMRLFSTDVGFTTDTIHGMRKAMFLAGKEYAEADRAIGSLGRSLKDIEANRYGSRIADNLMEIGAPGRDLAKTLINLAGNYEESMKAVEKVWREAGPRMRERMASAFGVSESDMDTIIDSWSHHLDKKVDEAAQRHALQIRGYRSLFKDAWDYALGSMLESLESFGQDERSLENIYRKKLGLPPKTQIDPLTKQQSTPERTAPGWTGYLPDWLTGLHYPTAEDSAKINENHPWLKSIDESIGLGAGKPSLIQRLKQKFSNTVMYAGAEALGPEASGRAVPVVSDKQMLSAIGWASGVEGLVGLGGVGAAYEGTIASRGVDLLRNSINLGRTVYGGATSALGFLGSGGNAEAAGLANVPFSGAIQALGRMFGIGGKDLASIEDDSNKTLGDIRDILQRMETGGGGSGGGRGGYTGNGRLGLGGQPGSGYTADRLGGGNAGYVSSGDNPEFTARVDRMIADAAKEGIHIGRGGGFRTRQQQAALYAQKPGLAAPPGSSLHELGLARDLTFGPGGEKWAHEHAAEYGMRFPMSYEPWHIQPTEGRRLAAGSGQVKGSYFTDRSTASGADASRISGIALPTREGLGKMYNVVGPDDRVTRLPQIDVGPAAWTGRGIDFSGPAAKSLGYDPTNKYFTYSLDDARARIDRAQSANRQVDAAMSASIDFRNMPSWVRTSVDDNGKFKNLKISRSTPQDGRAGSGQAAYNPWAYE